LIRSQSTEITSLQRSFESFKVRAIFAIINRSASSEKSSHSLFTLTRFFGCAHDDGLECETVLFGKIYCKKVTALGLHDDLARELQNTTKLMQKSGQQQPMSFSNIDLSANSGGGGSVSSGGAALGSASSSNLVGVGLGGSGAVGAGGGGQLTPRGSHVAALASATSTVKTKTVGTKTNH
jgi:hypothetical protein